MRARKEWLYVAAGSAESLSLRPVCRRKYPNSHSGLSETLWRATTTEKFEGPGRKATMAGIWAAFVAGFGMICVAAAMSYRRHRRENALISDEL